MTHWIKTSGPHHVLPPFSVRFRGIWICMSNGSNAYAVSIVRAQTRIQAQFGLSPTLYCRIQRKWSGTGRGPDARSGVMRQIVVTGTCGRPKSGIVHRLRRSMNAPLLRPSSIFSVPMAGKYEYKTAPNRSIPESFDKFEDICFSPSLSITTVTDKCEGLQLGSPYPLKNCLVLPTRFVA